MTETFDDLKPQERRMVRAIRQILNKTWPDKKSLTPTDVEEISKSATGIIASPRLMNLAVYGMNPPAATSIEVWKQDKIAALYVEDPPCDSPQSIMAWFLYQTHPSHEQIFLDALEEISPGFSKVVEQHLDPFEIILKYNNHAIHLILREVDTRDLGCALSGMPAEIKTHIYSNMSQRAAQMLEEDIQSMGSVDSRIIRVAQNRIIRIARRLIREGQITEQADGTYFAPAPAPDAAHKDDLKDGLEELLGRHVSKRMLLFKIILLSSLAVAMIALVIFVSWKVSTIQTNNIQNVAIRHP